MTSAADVSEANRVRAVALVKEGDSITIDARKQLIQLNVTDGEIARSQSVTPTSSSR